MAGRADAARHGRTGRAAERVPGTAHLRPEAEYSWSPNDFDFRTTYLEDADFQRATFSSLAGFRAAFFSGATALDGAAFSGTTIWAGKKRVTW